MITADTLRPPGPFDPTIGAYKDWLHLSVFDHDADLVGLVNVSLHGRPAAASTQVVAAALVDVAGAEWVGNVVPGSWADASITLTGVSTGAASVAFADHGLVLAAATVDGLRLRLLATPATDPFSVEIPQSVRFGLGRLAGRAAPRRRGLARAGRTAPVEAGASWGTTTTTGAGGTGATTSAGSGPA